MIAFDSLHLWSDRGWGGFPHIFFVQNLHESNGSKKAKRRGRRKKEKKNYSHQRIKQNRKLKRLRVPNHLGSEVRQRGIYFQRKLA